MIVFLQGVDIPDVTNVFVHGLPTTVAQLHQVCPLDFWYGVISLVYCLLLSPLHCIADWPSWERWKTS